MNRATGSWPPSMGDHINDTGERRGFHPRTGASGQAVRLTGDPVPPVVVGAELSLAALSWEPPW